MHTTTRTLTRRAIASALLTIPLLVAASCSNDESANPPATSAAIPNTPPPTILPPTTTELPATTEPPETEPPQTSAPAATTPPSSSPINDVEQAKRDVIAAAEHTWFVFNEVKLDPTSTEKLDAAVAAHTGAAQESIRRIIDEYRSNNRRSMTLELAPATIHVNEGSVQIDQETGAATVESCVLNTNVLVEIQGSSDGSDRVIDDTISSYLVREVFVPSDGQWLEADGTVLSTYEGALTCDAAG